MENPPISYFEKKFLESDCDFQILFGTLDYENQCRILKWYSTQKSILEKDKKYFEGGVFYKANKMIRGMKFKRYMQENFSNDFCCKIWDHQQWKWMIDGKRESHYFFNVYQNHESNFISFWKILPFNNQKELIHWYETNIIKIG